MVYGNVRVISQKATDGALHIRVEDINTGERRYVVATLTTEKV